MSPFGALSDCAPRAEISAWAIPASTRGASRSAQGRGRRRLRIALRTFSRRAAGAALELPASFPRPAPTGQIVEPPGDTELARMEEHGPATADLYPHLYPDRRTRGAERHRPGTRGFRNRPPRLCSSSASRLARNADPRDLRPGCVRAVGKRARSCGRGDALPGVGANSRQFHPRPGGEVSLRSLAPHDSIRAMRSPPAQQTSRPIY
jgi:hypothetical protein